LTDAFIHICCNVRKLNCSGESKRRASQGSDNSVGIEAMRCLESDHGSFGAASEHSVDYKLRDGAQLVESLLQQLDSRPELPR
jgi:hypothetical protein